MGAPMQIVQLPNRGLRRDSPPARLEKEKRLVFHQQYALVADFHHLLRTREAGQRALESTHIETFKRLTMATELKDEDTGGHAVRVARYSVIIAKAYGADDAFCRLLEHAALVHDVGKIGIPDSILQKKGALSAEEWLVMRQHPEWGARLLGDGPAPVLRMAAEIALCHHEKFNGSGYPQGLKGDRIPLAARIVAVADFFDAVTSDRCYRKAMPYATALTLLEDGRHAHFDPAVVDAFFEASKEFLVLRQTADAKPLDAEAGALP
jgi:putative two-component system response regulator